MLIQVFYTLSSFVQFYFVISVNFIIYSIWCVNEEVLGLDILGVDLAHHALRPTHYAPRITCWHRCVRVLNHCDAALNILKSWGLLVKKSFYLTVCVELSRDCSQCGYVCYSIYYFIKFQWYYVQTSEMLRKWNTLPLITDRIYM